MEYLNINNDYDSDIMETPKAKYLITYMEDFHPNVITFLNDNDIYFGFLFPYVTDFLDRLCEDISNGINKSDSNMENLKIVCSQIDEACNNIYYNITKATDNSINNFDLDSVKIIDSDL